MYASMLTRVADMALVVAMPVLTSGLAGAKLPAPTEEQKAQADLAKAKAAQGDKAAASQTCRTQDKTTASYRVGGKAARTQPGVPCVDPGPSVAPMPAASAPAPVAKR